MELAVIGATGKVGAALCRSWAGVHRVHAVGRAGMDLRNPAEVRRAVADMRCDVLINCAAMASPEACEASPEDAWAINAEAPGIMAAVCRGRGVRMVHFSTDYVLDGTRPGLKDENAPTGPVNHYGRTKLAGEERVREACPEAAVCRISWVFGTRPSGFLEAILNRARSGGPLEAVADKWSMPSCVHEIRRVVEMLAGHPELSGVFHLTGGGEPESWWSYGRKVLEIAESFGIIDHEWDILPRPMAEVPQLSAPRAAHTAMEPGRLRRELGWPVVRWEEAARDEICRIARRECH